MLTRRFFLFLIATGVFLFVAASAHAQYKLELCEDLKIAEARYGINTVETATCVNPTKTFSPKGTLRNIHMVYSFPKVPTGAAVTFMITKDNAMSADVRSHGSQPSDYTDSRGKNAGPIGAECL
jgi:hypothetical protein